MAFDWGDYLGFAEALNNSTETDFVEARKRSVVSRSYYAAYCIARDYAITKYRLTISNQENAHFKVINAFKDRGKKHGVFTCLLELRRWRNNCDYENEVVNLSSIAGNSLQKAKHAIDLINS